MMHLCDIAIVSACNSYQCTKTLPLIPCDHKEKQKQKKRIKVENHQNPHTWFRPFLQILNLDHFGLHHWLEMVTKHLQTLLKSKKLKSNQI